MTAKTKVLITGACGNLGRKLCRHLADRGHFLLTKLDVRGAADDEFAAADLSRYDRDWADRFDGHDVVVHLAADPRPNAPWASLQRNNIDATIHVYAAALAHQVRRVVFASTCRVMLGHRPTPLLTHDMIPDPVDYYAATKVFGERLGKRYADQFGLSTICLRIGSIRPGANEPGAFAFDAQRRWLSNRDFCDAAEKAIQVADVGFAALFLTSDSSRPYVDLSETTRVLGFRPQDYHDPKRPGPVASITRRLPGTLRRYLQRARSRSDN